MPKPILRIALEKIINYIIYGIKGNFMKGNKPIIFLFSGQGSQYYHMGHELYSDHPRFKYWMDTLNSLVHNHTKEYILPLLYDPRRKKNDLFNQTIYTHPAIYMYEYSLAKTLEELGIYPEYVLGASLGEFVAATVSKIISLEDAIISVIKQAMCLERYCDKGGMLAVIAPIELYQNTILLHNNAEIASYNCSSTFVISGNMVCLKRIIDYLKIKNITYALLPVIHAFHSSFIDAARPSYLEFLEKQVHIDDASSSKISFLSCLADFDSTSVTSNHFWDCIHKPMSIQQTIAALELKGPFTYLDLSPSGTFANIVKYNLSKRSYSEVYAIDNPFKNAKVNFDEIINILLKR